jgi:inner membrane protein
MPFELLYWHWIIFGVALLLVEIAVSTFFVLWFAVAALILGGVIFFIPSVSANWQIFIWTLLSTALAALWFRYLKPLSVDRTKAGLSREAIVGEVGQVILAPGDDRRGRLRFPAPILGDDEWQIISDQQVSTGDRVRVVDVAGNALLVEKVQ